jgi:hypothetical protein
MMGLLEKIETLKKDLYSTITLREGEKGFEENVQYYLEGSELQEGPLVQCSGNVCYPSYSQFVKVQKRISKGEYQRVLGLLNRIGTQSSNELIMDDGSVFDLSPCCEDIWSPVKPKEVTIPDVEKRKQIKLNLQQIYDSLSWYQFIAKRHIRRVLG